MAQLSKYVTKGTNLAYFSDINGKINFISSILLENKEKDIFYIDFDTLFTSFFQTNTLNFSLENFQNLKMFLPHNNNFESILETVLNNLSCDSIIIIDSLNGLLDHINIKNLSRTKNKNKKTGSEKRDKYIKSAGHQSLKLLFLLMKKIEDKDIPILILVYQSSKRLEKLKIELLIDSTTSQSNHYIRLSSSIFVLDFLDEFDKTCFTVLKSNKNHLVKPSEFFYPHSIWWEVNFLKVK